MSDIFFISLTIVFLALSIFLINTLDGLREDPS